MRNEVRWTIYLMGLGMSLVAYAHYTFATKSLVERMFNKIDRIDDRVLKIYERGKK